MKEVIEWLRSPEGEQWSHDRSPSTGNPVRNQPTVNSYPGFFSLKEDSTHYKDMYTSYLWWGELPGDRKLKQEYLNSPPEETYTSGKEWTP